MCLMHREVKQTEMSEFGAEKDLLQDHTRRWVAHVLKKTLSSPRVLAKHFLKAGWWARITGYVLRLCRVLLTDGEVTGWCHQG